MDIHLTGHYNSIQSGVEALESHYRFTLKERACIQVNCQQTDNDALKVVFDGEQATITYQVKSHFFRAFGLFLEAIQNGQTYFSIMETPQFKTVGPMFDLISEERRVGKEFRLMKRSENCLENENVVR